MNWDFKREMEVSTEATRTYTAMPCSRNWQSCIPYEQCVPGLGVYPRCRLFGKFRIVMFIRLLRWRISSFQDYVDLYRYVSQAIQNLVVNTSASVEVVLYAFVCIGM